MLECTGNCCLLLPIERLDGLSKGKANKNLEKYRISRTKMIEINCMLFYIQRQHL